MLAPLPWPSTSRVPAFGPFVLPLSALALAAATAGCGPSVPTFPRFGLDAGTECDEAVACGTGEVCIQGRCYDECTATSCGPGETCVAGVCTGFSGDAGRDAGRDAPPVDAPPDPCAALRCMTPTPYCIAGNCVTCASQADCGGLTPVCDLSRGNCVAVETANPVCAPCNNELDCLGMGTCTTLTGATFTERVCLPPVALGCPAGMRMMGATGPSCVPVLGASCRNYVAARQRMACVAAADCVPLGAVEGVDFVAATCAANVCAFPCGSPSDCPPGLTVCDATSYCSP